VILVRNRDHVGRVADGCAADGRGRGRGDQCQSGGDCQQQREWFTHVYRPPFRRSGRTVNRAACAAPLSMPWPIAAPVGLYTPGASGSRCASRPEKWTTLAPRLPLTVKPPTVIERAQPLPRPRT